MKKLLVALLVAVCAFTLVACAPKDYASAKAKMEEAGYTCIGSELTEANEDGCVAVLNCTLISLTNPKNLTCALYDSAKNAKAAYEELKGEEENNNLVRVGKWVIYGSEDAVEAFKK